MLKMNKVTVSKKSESVSVSGFTGRVQPASAWRRYSDTVIATGVYGAVLSVQALAEHDAQLEFKAQAEEYYAERNKCVDRRYENSETVYSLPEYPTIKEEQDAVMSEDAAHRLAWESIRPAVQVKCEEESEENCTMLLQEVLPPVAQRHSTVLEEEAAWEADLLEKEAAWKARLAAREEARLAAREVPAKGGNSGYTGATPSRNPMYVPESDIPNRQGVPVPLERSRNYGHRAGAGGPPSSSSDDSIASEFPDYASADEDFAEKKKKYLAEIKAMRKRMAVLSRARKAVLVARANLDMDLHFESKWSNKLVRTRFLFGDKVDTHPIKQYEDSRLDVCKARVRLTIAEHRLARLMREEARRVQKELKKDRHAAREEDEE